MPIQGVIFDLDGTLVNTLDDLANAANGALAARGFPTHPVPDYRFFIGDGAETLVKRVLPEDRRTPEIINEVLHAFREDYSQNWQVCSAPYDGIPSLLEALKQRGIRKAVLSNKPHEYTLLTIEGFFPARTFDLVLGMRDTVPEKPDPAGAFEIARHWDMPTDQIAFLGDGATDMVSATSAGMLPLGALWGYRGEKELNDAGAKALLSQPAELLDWL